MATTEKRDYYEVLGVAAHGRDRRDQEGLPQARGEVPPRQEPGRRRGRGEVQGGGRGVRRALRRREARALRPLRPPGRRRAWAASIPNQFADFGDILGDLFGFGDFFGDARTPRRQRVRRAATTCATTCSSTSWRRCSARKSRCDVPRLDHLRDLQRHRREAGNAAGDLHRLRRPRPDPLLAGLLRRGAHLPAVRRRGEGDQGSVRVVRRRGTRARREEDLR